MAKLQRSSMSSHGGLLGILAAGYLLDQLPEAFAALVAGGIWPTG